MAIGKGAYWIGGDGNVWGNIQGIGHRNLGKASDIYARGGIVSNQVNGDGNWVSSGNLGESQYWNQIADPNSGKMISWDTFNQNTNNAPNQTNPSANRNLSYGNGGGSSAASTAKQNAAWQAEHDQTADYLQRLFDSLGGRQSAAENSVSEQYNQKFGALNNARDAAFQNLDSEQNKLDKQRGKSQNQLGEDFRNLLQSTSTELGMFGAGNSSASQMAAVGATNLANEQTADITDQYNEQTGDVALNRDQTKKKFEDDNNELNIWKKGQFKNIRDDFDNQKNTIQDLQNQNGNTLRQRLAGNGVASPNIDAGIQSRINDISSRYANTSAPNTTLQNLPQYKANGIDRANLAGKIDAPQVDPSQAMEYLNPTKKDDKKKQL